jgi:Uma2 family endonuclease
MRTMSTRTTHSEVLEAAEHLPDEATLVIHGFDWDEYERLLDDLRKTRRLRVSYNSGSLRIMAISPEHEEYARVIEFLIVAFCDETEITLEARGSATWRIEALAKGVEADDCYYVQNSQRIIGKRNIDLPKDPPPDFVIEVDLTTEARHKFPIYAALGVSEVWRYDGETIQVYHLRNGEYVETNASEVLPGLSIELLVETLNISKTEGQTAARKHIRGRLRAR